MWRLQRIDALALVGDSKYISFVGAGGKSTLIEYIAERAALCGKTVAVTTTTKILAKEPYVLVDGLGTGPDGRPVRVGKTREGEKLTALTFQDLLTLGGVFDMVLIEADGAKHHPLKYPAHHEPVIPPFSDSVLVVAGLDALHGRVDRYVFRWEIFCEATGTAPDAALSEDLFASFFSGSILLKGVEREKCTIILNKCDALRDRGEAIRMAKRVLRGAGLKRAVVSSPHHGLFYGVKELQ